MAVAPVSAEPSSSIPSSSSSPSSAQAPRLSLLQNLSTQSILITQLFSLLSSGLPPVSPATITGSQLPNFNVNANASAQAIEQIYAAIQLSTLDLSGLVKETYEHQAEWQRFLAKKREVEGLEKRVRGVMRRLEACRGELEEMVEIGREVRRDIERSETNPIPSRLLLSTAQSISKHTSAPIPPISSSNTTTAEGGSGVAPPPTVIDKSLYAPWPSEMNMRQGLLFQLEGSMGGMGERGVVGDELPSTTNQVQDAQSQAQPQEPHQAPAHAHVHHEEPSRRYDPNAVFDLALNSDSDDD
ncbi:hypothetical protein I316_02642 [Kwoniella heveanensis BCC8398]|uniref:Mediator of RNA polymerase II transcription subunit 4 n=1 Tax=Kwoniella heveanensis BCC8398 TaxID=1296120 RepID=A0A1B9GX29_9TREE|nr:hypothetical protein I316_02642 [Kwoniella heveanensis BCC8398]